MKFYQITEIESTAIKKIWLQKTDIQTKKLKKENRTIVLSNVIKVESLIQTRTKSIGCCREVSY